MDLNVYNYLITGWNTKPATTKYSAHKSSELRSVLKDIAKRTMASPVYMVHLSDDKQAYALQVKESSIALHTSFQELMNGDADALFVQRKATSSDEEQVGVWIDTDDYDALPDSFSLKVNQLANTQVNMSKEFYETSKSLEAGTYRFRIAVNDVSYDFQYNIKKDAKHSDVIGGLSDFITKAHIGVVASPVSREAGKIAMRLESDVTGTPDGDVIMSFEDRPDGQHPEGIVSYYGLNRVIRQPENAQFELNGVDKQSMSNRFKLARSLQVEMRHVGEQAADISYMPDDEKIMKGVENMVDSYNRMVESSWNYQKETGHMPKLVREMQTVLHPFLSDLESAGITVDEKGTMHIDESLAYQSAVDGTFQDLLGENSALGMRMLAKTNSVKLDPMEYVDKTLVSYPNTSKAPVGYAYNTSLYGGMLFNYYC